MKLCLNLIIFVLFAFICACENSDDSKYHQSDSDSIENGSGDMDSDTFEEIQTDTEENIETETVQQISQGSETETDSEEIEPIETDTSADSESVNNADMCTATLSRILECQGNSARYYAVKESCNDEFLTNESQCAIDCVSESDCAGFLQCFGGC